MPDAPEPLSIPVRPGVVSLIGAGPGDPKLITVAGREALERADVVVYDRLAHPRLLEHAPPHALRIFAGKTADRHTMTQDEINSALAEHALAGRAVARLKGGDPFVFGRGGEEAQYLRERGVPFVVMPGVTSAIAAPAYAGIPVTHRDDASSFAVVTGHERAETRESATRSPGDAEQRRRWERIAWAADTLVFLMGVENIDEIAARLVEQGRDPATPVAMVRWGTWAGRQETLVATLADVAARVREAKFKAPAVTVVGDVVRWRERLRWWDNRPLSGRRVVVTRAREQASDLARALNALGADAVEFPTIRIQPPTDGYRALDAAARGAGDYGWLFFASGPAVDAFFDRLDAVGRDARALAACQVAAVGRVTAERLRRRGVRADFVPETFTAEDAARALPGELSGARVLMPRVQEGGTDAALSALTARGASVEVVAAYENVPDHGDVDAVRAMLADGEIDAATFTSSSTVRNFAQALGADAAEIARSVTLACIGPTTAQTAREVFGREPEIVAAAHTVEGLVDAVAAWYGERKA